MKVLNTSKNIILVEGVSVAKTIFENAEGLLNVLSPHAMLLRTRWGIHTFGMHFPIDVVITDDAYGVRNIKRGLLPNRLFFWNPRFCNVFEFPEDTVQKSGTEIGDTLVLIEEK